MKKKALAKDFWMEIRTSLNRFLSIFFIVALGVAFFSGIRASEPDMRYSGDAYFDVREMMDLKVLSSLGLTEKDIEAIRQIEGVEKVEPGYMADVLSTFGESERVVHIESLPETINQVDIEDGRLPETKGEVVLDVDMADNYGIKVGDKLRLKSGNDTELMDLMATDELTVVGTCSSPMYISFDRGSTNVGSGEISMFAYVTEASFSQEVFSQAYVTVVGARTETAFTEDYRQVVESVQNRIEDIADGRCDIRYAEIMDEANEKIDEAESELNEAKAEAESELAEAEAELRNGEAELSDGKNQLSTSSKELEDAKNQLLNSRGTLDSGWSQYYDGVAQMESGKTALAEAEAELAANEAALLDGEAKISEAEVELAAKDSELAEAEAGIADAKALLEGLNAGWGEYQAGMSGLETMQNQLAVLDALIASGGATEEQILQAETLRGTIAEVSARLEGAAAELQAMEAMRPQAEAAIAMEGEVIAGRQALEAGRAELETQKANLASGREQMEAGRAELERQKQNAAAGEAALDDSYNQLISGEDAYQSGWNQIQSGEAELSNAWATIAENEQKLADGWAEYEKGKKEAEEKISDAEVKIMDARSEIEGLERPSWYVNDRESYTDYSGYSDNADRMRAIGQVFPILFFLVAALISLTTMTRMVEEQRTQIGTLKALGYSKFSIASKYLGYALAATLGGCLAGVLIGQKIFPYIIVSAYKIMYIHIPDVVIPYHLEYSLTASAVALACTMLATISACYQALRAQPAELMRPEAPKAGKRVFLERIPWIWNHLNFTWKSTVRNLLRYKKRFFMTVFGIGGCMALMLVGYGLKDSIMDIAKYQYNRIQIYDMMAIVDENMTEEEVDQMEGQLAADSRLTGYMNGYFQMTEISSGDKKKDVYLYVPETLDRLENYVTFNYRRSGEQWRMSEDSVILSEKAARDMGVAKGDEIQLTLEDDRVVPVRITDICENYLSHYLYIAPKVYQSLAGAEAENNCVYMSVADEYYENLESIGQELLKNDGILTISYTNNIEGQLEDMLATLDDVIIVLIISAGMLAFVVLYNLNNININERKRELATLKVLGFYDGEIGAYVYRENILLTIIGAAMGCVLGRILHLFVVRTVEVEMTMFGRNIEISSFVWSIVFTCLFSLLVNLVMYFKLKKIDMIESLKSVE